MTNRSANATIKGYYYQFDATILKLLELGNDTDSVVVEGIEDIDIKTATEYSTVQCKYLSKPRFINSTVREPIILMLEHFINNTVLNLKYTLYAHFENETAGITPNISLEKLKEILIYKEGQIKKVFHIDRGISDHQLNSFLSRFNLIFGMDFGEQQKLVLTKLQKLFGCSDFDADTLFYNNSLRIILDRAREPNVGKRKITKREFITSINCKKRLFNEWYIQLKSKEKYLNLVKKGIQSSKALEASKDKYIFIGKEIFDGDNSELPLCEFIENLINKYYRMGNVLRNAKPLTLIIDDTDKKVIEYKKILINRGIKFNDGYEHLEFSYRIFNEGPIIYTSNGRNRITTSSYLVRLVSRNTFEQDIRNINHPKVVMSFSKSDCIYDASDKYQLFDIKYCENLIDINKIVG